MHEQHSYLSTGRPAPRSIGEALYKDAGATHDDLREAVNTLEDVARTARRVLGGAHPSTAGIEILLQDVRAKLRAREESDVCERVAAMSA